jgi:NTP pyrophosphatase (non-canonical NTP hydrolase)
MITPDDRNIDLLPTNLDEESSLDNKSMQRAFTLAELIVYRERDKYRFNREHNLPITGQEIYEVLHTVGLEIHKISQAWETYISTIGNVRGRLLAEYPMSFQGLRKANKSRCKRWHKGGLEEWSVTDWATAMMGEAGEMCNAIKKLRRIETDALNINEPGRQFTDRKTAVESIAKEMGDTLIYMDLLAQRLGVDLEKSIIEVFNQKSKEYGFPERLVEPIGSDE